MEHPLRAIILAVLLLTLVLCLSGDTRSQCYKAALDKYNKCNSDADASRAAQQKRIDDRYTKCKDPFQNPSWTACRNQVYDRCGSDQNCISTGVAKC